MNSLEDCHFFLTSGCNKGASCNFRHSEAVKSNPSVPECTYWLQGTCSRPDCGFKHPSRAARAPAMPQKQICVYFVNGNCRNGANCRYAHFIPNAFQGAAMIPQQYQPIAHHQQRMQRQPVEPVEEDEATKAARIEKLLSKPLGEGGRKRQAQGSVKKKKIIQTKKLKLNRKQPGNGQRRVIKLNKKKDNSNNQTAKTGVANKAEPASKVKIKSLSEIMAQKQKQEATPKQASVKVPLPGLSGVVASNGLDGDDELRALGIDPDELGGAASGTMEDLDVDIDL